MTKIKVAAVNYLNTKPLLYGIKTSSIINEIELTEDYPARVAQLLLQGKADVGLVPVAVIPQLSINYIITDYCIGCDGAVASVCLFSDVPVERIEQVHLDYQSRTSVQLVKILFEEFWKKQPQFIDAGAEDFRSSIKGTTAGVVIGDRAFEQRTQSKYVYDLGSVWKQHTSLPFVFAAWVSNKELPQQFVEDFNAANGIGLKNLDIVVAENQYDAFNLKEYYTRYISYTLDSYKRQGLDLFLKKL